MRFFGPAVIAALFAGLSFAVRERWGSFGSVWLVGIILAVWLVLWGVTRYYQRVLRDRGIEVDDD